MLDYQTLKAFHLGLIQDAQTPEVPDFLEPEPIVPAALAEMPALMPRLVDLSRLDRQQIVAALGGLNQQVQEGQDPWLAVLLRSDRPAETVARHLRSRLVIELADVGACFFRFFDPRVLVQLPWMLTPAQLAWLFGPVRAFHVCLHQTWRTIELPATQASLHLALTPEQSFTLTHVQPMNEVLADVDGLDIDERVRLGRTVIGHFRTARELGLRTQPDRKAFARHALAVHPDFHRHDQVQACLLAMDDQDDHPYVAATQALDDEDWLQIQTDMSRTGELHG
ncbi:DUF4123 domain-containing protein [Achromobacter pestifer]|uniref:DUF4123 domain-containing protein n=1 Tax=Achromobacter pestifer TaxID=1353889 RepID=A0A6S6ZI55_9BURK|nr:DUF4123 domain-containing protein [Achromobacter pestifer]CAB3649683.1 hypothetical protein LMG3431_02763 [Achromobacter pestifer]